MGNFMMTLRSTIRALLTMAAFAVLLAGCLGSSGDQTFADGYYRFIHISPGAGNVSITANGGNVTSSLAYRAATNYYQLPWGTPPLQVQTNPGGVTYINNNIPVAGSGHYSYFLYGGGASTIGLGVRDDVGDAASGQFLMREIHLATGIGGVDIYLLGAGASVATATPIFSSLVYGGNTGFAGFSIGDYNLVVTPTGSKTVIYDSGKQSFPQNSKVSLVIYATGSASLVNAALLFNNSAGTTTFVDNPAARFRFLSATADVPFVDLLIDSAVALGNVAYGGASQYGPIAAGTRNFKLEPTSNQGAYIYDQNQPVAGGYDYSLAAFSYTGTGAAGLMVMQDNNLPPPSGKATLRIVNASSDTSAYDCYANATKLVAGIASTTATAYQVLDGGTYTLSFNPAGTSSATTAVEANLAAGHTYTVYVWGTASAPVTGVVTDN
jgi:hypothetical protein